MKTPTTLPLLFAAILHGNSEAVGTDYEYRKTLLRSHKPSFETNTFFPMKPTAFALTPEPKSPISEDESSHNSSSKDLLTVEDGEKTAKEDGIIDDGTEVDGEKARNDSIAMADGKESTVAGTKQSPFPNRRRYQSGKKKNMRAASTNTSSSGSPAPSFGTAAIMAALSAALIMGNT